MSNTTVIYCGILTLEKAGNTVNYYGILITLDPGVKNTTIFNIRKRWYHGKLLWHFYTIGPRLLGRTA
jgi:hypothetical protein